VILQGDCKGICAFGQLDAATDGAGDRGRGQDDSRELDVDVGPSRERREDRADHPFNSLTSIRIWLRKN